MGHVGKVLVVDDDPESADIHSLLLVQKGYDVLKGYSGEEVLEIAGSAMPERS